MTSLLVTNAHLAALDEENRCFENGGIYIEDQLIVDAGNISGDRYKPDRTIDAGGRLVMPGLINAHHHLYSTFARGFAPPGEPARNFEQILSQLWWKLDKALNEEDVYYSSLLALMEAARAGCTTIIDHHASPSCVNGSLDQVERAFRDVGLNGCLCYEVSDRNREGEGIEENERYLRKCREHGDGQMAAMFGLHASMTLGNRTMERCSDIGHELDAGFHVHVAEDAADVRQSHKNHGMSVVDRFDRFGMLGPKSILVHGVHLDPVEWEKIRAADAQIVVNPESNMNNAVGLSPMLDMFSYGLRVGLGTDGMSAHMIAQARALYLSQRHAQRDPTTAFVEACSALLDNNRVICNRLFAEPRGALVPGQLADIAIMDYVPFTPLHADNFYGHLLYGLDSAQANTTISRGKVVLDEGRLSQLDEEGIRARCVERARLLWSRIR